MKAAIRIATLLVTVTALSIAADGELIRLTTGVTANYMLWQASPPVFASETYWGGVGIDVLYRSLTLSGLVTITDLEALTITTDPAFYFAAAISYLRVGSINAFIEGGLIIDTPSPFWIAATTATGFSWSPLPFATVRAHVGYEVVVRGPSGGSGVYVGIGVSVCIPLL